MDRGRTNEKSCGERTTTFSPDEISTGPISLSLPHPRFRFVGYIVIVARCKYVCSGVVRRQMSHGNRVLCPMDQDSPQKLIDRIEPNGITIRGPRRLTIVSLGESPLRIRSEQRPQNPRNPHSPTAMVANHHR